MSFIIEMDLSTVNWAGFTVIILLIALSLAAFGQFLGVLSVLTKEWTNIAVVSTAVLLICTGAIIPIDFFPDWFQVFPPFIPITNGLIAIRETIDGASLNSTYVYLLRELLLLAGYLSIGYIGFLFIEKRAKQTGSLE